MKKFALLLAIVMMVMSLVACSQSSQSSQSSETSEITEPSLPNNIIEANPMFIEVGNTIEINGATYNANTLYENGFGNANITHESTFIINRINGHIIRRTSCYTYHGNYVYSEFDTGLVYEGTITIAGVEIQIPEQPQH